MFCILLLIRRAQVPDVRAHAQGVSRARKSTAVCACSREYEMAAVEHLSESVRRRNLQKRARPRLAAVLARSGHPRMRGCALDLLRLSVEPPMPWMRRIRLRFRAAVRRCLNFGSLCRLFEPGEPEGTPGRFSDRGLPPYVRGGAGCWSSAAAASPVTGARAQRRRNSTARPLSEDAVRASVQFSSSSVFVFCILLLIRRAQVVQW